MMQRAFAAVRQGVLGQMRMNPSFALQSEAAAPLSLNFLRMFADASYLDKKEVTERVLNVVKNFEKVDEAKVRRCRELFVQPFHKYMLIAPRIACSFAMGFCATSCAEPQALKMLLQRKNPVHLSQLDTNSRSFLNAGEPIGFVPEGPWSGQLGHCGAGDGD